MALHDFTRPVKTARHARIEPVALTPRVVHHRPAAKVVRLADPRVVHHRPAAKVVRLADPRVVHHRPAAKVARLADPRVVHHGPAAKVARLAHLLHTVSKNLPTLHRLMHKEAVAIAGECYTKEDRVGFDEHGPSAHAYAPTCPGLVDLVDTARAMAA
jgi:hypothetical protein